MGGELRIEDFFLIRSLVHCPWKFTSKMRLFGHFQISDIIHILINIIFTKVITRTRNVVQQAAVKALIDTAECVSGLFLVLK